VDLCGRDCMDALVRHEVMTIIFNGLAERLSHTA
jgi:hypothetical protein